MCDIIVIGFILVIIITFCLLVPRWLKLDDDYTSMMQNPYFEHYLNVSENVSLVNMTNNYNEIWALDQAVIAARKSKCKSQRGIVIWHREHGLISDGFNAPPKPFVCDSSEACRANCAKTALHAEQVALLKLHKLDKKIPIGECEMIHVKVVNDEAVVSDKPSCWQCSKLILEAGLKSMWLYQNEGLVEYSAEDFHLKTLQNCNLV